jgi:multimeric flavodoxin WrbA
MKLTILNGSPRGKNSNSDIIIKWLLENIENNPVYETETIYLNKINEHKNTIDKILHVDMVIIVFPLYTDCMPGLVMAFIEKLQSIKEELKDKKFGFIVHSGFPETCHSRYIERYLVWLTKELKSDYMGTVILGGSEGLRIMPESMTRKKRNLFNRLGEKMVKEGNFNTDLIKKVEGRERMSKSALFIYKVLAKTGITNFYWNGQLKRNKAYNNRYARPYLTFFFY